MEGDLIGDSQFGQGGDVVDDTVRIVWRGSNQKDGVWIYQSPHTVHIHHILGRRASDLMDLDTKVAAGFRESGVCRARDNHLRMSDPSFGVAFLSGGETSHEDRLGTSRCGGSCT